MPLHTLAQLELPGRWIDRTPGEREPGLERQVGVPPDERVVEVDQDVHRMGQGRLVRIARLHVDALCHDQRVGCLGVRGRDGAREGADEQGQHTERRDGTHHPVPPDLGDVRIMTWERVDRPGRRAFPAPSDGHRW